jgi:hypothetical protein
MLIAEVLPGSKILGAFLGAFVGRRWEASWANRTPPLSARNTNVKKATSGWLFCICFMAERSRAPAGPARGIRRPRPCRGVPPESSLCCRVSGSAARRGRATYASPPAHPQFRGTSMQAPASRRMGYVTYFYFNRTATSLPVLFVAPTATHYRHRRRTAGTTSQKEEDKGNAYAWPNIPIVIDGILTSVNIRLFSSSEKLLPGPQKPLHRQR